MTNKTELMQEFETAYMHTFNNFQDMFRLSGGRYDSDEVQLAYDFFTFKPKSLRTELFQTQANEIEHLQGHVQHMIESSGKLIFERNQLESQLAEAKKDQARYEYIVENMIVGRSILVGRNEIEPYVDAAIASKEAGE